MSKPDHAQKSSLRQAFNKAFAHGFVTFALAATAAQAQDSAPAAPQADPYATQAALQDVARSKFTDLVRAADPAGYGARLSALEDRLNSYLSRYGADNSRHNSVVVLNPAEIDVSLMIDRDLHEMVRARITARGGSAHDDRIQMVVSNLQDTTVTAGGTGTFTQAPMAALQLPADGRATCIIIPAPEHDKPYSIPGLTTRQMEDYLNMHEGWHCLDGHYNATEAQKDALRDARTLAQLQGNTAAQHALAAVNLQEALADVGALGDMIRAGASPRIIRHVAAWRSGPTEIDLEHNTVPALQALEKHINGVGLAAFRKMDDTQARQLYFRIADDHGLTQPRLQAAVDTLFSPAVDAARHGQPGLQGYYNQRLVQVSDFITRGGITPAPADAEARGERLRKGIGSWDARDMLEREAMRRSGEITIESLVYAYGHLKADLQRGMNGSGGAAEVKSEQLSRLRIEMVLMATRDYDFDDANRRHRASPARPAAAQNNRASAPASP